MSTLDAEALATLTPEEQAAIKDDEYSPEELEAMKKIAGDADASDGDGDDDGDDDDDDDDDKAAADAPPQEGKAAAAVEPAADAAQAADDAIDATVATAAPTYEAKLPVDFDAKVQGLAEQEQSAWAKFDDGEIDRAELQKQLRDIEQSRSDLNTARIKAEISQEMTAQTAQQQWANAINRSMRDFAKAENGGIDYRKDEGKAADLDQFVKVLASNPANEDKPMDWFLAEAHKRVLALHGVAQAKRETVADATARRKPPVDAAPKTLAQVPGGDGPGDVAGEFADLDALEGNDLEAAIAKMSPAQRERFARA